MTLSSSRISASLPPAFALGFLASMMTFRYLFSTEMKKDSTSYQFSRESF